MSPAFGIPSGLEIVILFLVLLAPVVVVFLAIRLTRRERRDVGFPVEPTDPAKRPPGGG
jgi:hypothetical protein